LLQVPVDPQNAKPKLPDVVHWRFAAFSTFLRTTSFRGEVLIVDARDTIFQSDPFVPFLDYTEDGYLVFFEEQLTIEQEPVNRMWVEQCAESHGFTDKAAAGDYFGAFRTLNGGTMLGRSEALTAYFDIMADEMANHFCNDQGMHMFLTYAGAYLGRYKMYLEPSSGVSNALQGNRVHDIYKLRPDGVLVNLLDKPFAIVHQWDRIPGVGPVWDLRWAKDDTRRGLGY
jgi:hypothetical protein